MIVGAFDISKSVTGWAMTDGRVWESGMLRCPIQRPPNLKVGSLNAEYTGQVADWFDREVFALLGKYTPDHVGIEQPMPGNSTKRRRVVDTSSQWAGQAFRMEEVGGTQFDVTHFLHGLVVIAARVCARKNITPHYVASQTWRSTTGVGRPPKSLDTYQKRRTWLKNEAKRICGLHGIKVAGADQAEACLIALHLSSILNPRIAARADDLFRQGAST